LAWQLALWKLTSGKSGNRKIGQDLIYQNSRRQKTLWPSQNSRTTGNEGEGLPINPTEPTSSAYLLHQAFKVDPRQGWRGLTGPPARKPPGFRHIFTNKSSMC
jgi:hypothetical protein